MRAVTRGSAKMRNSLCGIAQTGAVNLQSVVSNLEIANGLLSSSVEKTLCGYT